MDFGISRTFCENKKDPYKNVSKQLMFTDLGTYIYQAPEMHNQIGYTKKIDLWAIGVVCYEILTGNHPFKKIMYISDLERNLISIHL